MWPPQAVPALRVQRSNQQQHDIHLRSYFFQSTVCRFAYTSTNSTQHEAQQEAVQPQVCREEEVTGCGSTLHYLFLLVPFMHPDIPKPNLHSTAAGTTACCIQLCHAHPHSRERCCEDNTSATTKQLELLWQQDDRWLPTACQQSAERWLQVPSNKRRPNNTYSKRNSSDYSQCPVHNPQHRDFSAVPLPEKQGLH
jgi:hypothetical protein